jgi:pyruvate dehydrogenase E2 component (dihydrolipoamide acetyltransferase)
MAKEKGVDLGHLAGSGPRGRIKAADVTAAAAATRVAAPLTAGLAGVAPDAVHAAMARRMVQSKRDVPHFYLASEAEVTALMELRRQLNGIEGYPRVTLNHLVVAAVGVALREMPQANRIWLDGRIVSFDSTDVGVAISTPRGLFAPVLRDAGRIGIDRVASRADALAEAARTGKLTAGDLEGGAITVSNAGMFNVTRFAPIVNPPQAAILGVGSVRELFRPDADGRPSLKREMGLVLSCDHRILDGVAGLALLNRIIDILQAPLRLLRTGAA